MRRGLALTLTVAMLGSLLAGCGSSGGGSAPKADATAAAAPAGGGTEEVTTPDKVLKFTDQNAEDSPAGMWEQKFADLVKEYTKGHIEV